MMKKLISFMMAAVLTVSLAACGSGTTNGTGGFIRCRHTA